MFALEQFIIGLLIVHVAWLYFYVCGTLVRAPRSDESGSQAALSIVIGTASGMAITGFATFVLGLAWLIRPLGFALWLVLLVLAFIWRGDSPLRTVFWQVRFRTIRAAAFSPVVIIYLIGLIDAVPANLPDRQFDALFDYSVLSLEYARTHHLFVDMFQRTPFYTYNWLMVETWMFVFSAGDYEPFLTWLTGMLSLVGIFSVVNLELLRFPQRSRSTIVVVNVIAGASTAALAFNPMFLWMNAGGQVDVQLGYFCLVAILACALIVRWHDRSYLPGLILASAFLVGIKISFILLFPVFFATIWAIMRVVGAGRKEIIIALTALTVLSSPWYLNNLVLDGDPTPPVFNLLLHGHDVKFSAADAQGQVAALGKRRGPLGLVTLPIDMFFNTDPNEFVSDGVTGVSLLLMLPAALVAFSLIGGGVGIDIVVISAVLLYAIVYWLLTSYHVRYGLLFDAALCAFVGIVFVRAVRRFPSLGPVIALLAIGIALPSPNTGPWFQYFWNFNYLASPANFTGRETFLAPRFLGYPEGEYVAAELERLGRTSEHVYAARVEDLKYLFAQHGITSIGDWSGPEGYTNFASAIDNGVLSDFMNRFQVGAVLIPRNTPILSPIQMQEFDQQLERIGFSRYVCRGNVILIYIKDDPRAPDCTL